MGFKISLNKHCQAMFDKFNHRYFGGRLPRYRVCCGDYIDWRGRRIWGKIYRRQRLIRLRKSPDKKAMVSVLLHEMVHAATIDGHGKKFREKIEELRRAGAPVADYEFEPPLGPTRFTKDFVRSVMEDALCLDINTTLW